MDAKAPNEPLKVVPLTSRGPPLLDIKGGPDTAGYERREMPCAPRRGVAGGAIHEHVNTPKVHPASGGGPASFQEAPPSSAKRDKVTNEPPKAPGSTLGRPRMRGSRTTDTAGVKCRECLSQWGGETPPLRNSPKDPAPTGGPPPGIIWSRMRDKAP